MKQMKQKLGLTKNRLIGWLASLGILVSFALLAWIYGPSVMVEASYQAAKDKQNEQQSGQPTRGFGSLMTSMAGFNQLLDDKMIEEAVTVAQLEPASKQFGLVIPKIFLNVSVIENVNPDNKEVYQSILKEGGSVAHAKGTALPGEPGAVYIFGHSTDASFNVSRYNAVFYLLRRLEPGDEISVWYFFKEYKYVVTEKKTVDADDISDLVNVENEQKLILQTCWPPGTDWKRLLIIAKPLAV